MSTPAYLFWPPDDLGPLQGYLKWDVVTSEQHELSSNITSHPVERGLDVTDNVRPTPDGITLEVFCSNSPVKDVMGRGASTQSVPLDVPKYTPPLAPTPGAVFGAVSGALQNAVSNLFGFKADPITAQVMQFQSDFDAVAEAYATLQDLRDRAQLVTVSTGVREYSGFVIEHFTLVRDASSGDGGKFTISLRQIRLVESKLVKAPVPTEVRGAVPVNKGAKGASDAKDATRKRSALKKLTGVK